VGAETKFRNVGLADTEGAGVAKPLDDEGVAVREVVSVDRGAFGGRKTDGVVEVLEGDRQPMEGTGRLTGGEGAVGGVGQGERLLVVEFGDDGVDLGVDPRDLREMRRHQLARRDPAVTEQVRQFPRRRKAEFVCAGTHSARSL
jgi:hypothetical protein